MEIRTSLFTSELTVPTEAPHVFLTNIAGLLFVERPAFTDERGFFREVGNVADIEAVTRQPFIVKQINHSSSIHRVIRGIHAEGWNKLVTAITGVAFCALVDLRERSSTFMHVQLSLLVGGMGALYIPKGVGNSICVTSEETFNYLYAVDRAYAERDPADDRAINVFDPHLAIPWPFPAEDLILSDRDRGAISVQDLFPCYTFTEHK